RGRRCASRQGPGEGSGGAAASSQERGDQAEVLLAAEVTGRRFPFFVAPGASAGIIRLHALSVRIPRAKPGTSRTTCGERIPRAKPGDESNQRRHSWPAASPKVGKKT